MRLKCDCCDAVVGVSGDDVESHKKFKSELDIPFQLLADEGNEVSVTKLQSCSCHRVHHVLRAPGRADKVIVQFLPTVESPVGACACITLSAESLVDKLRPGPEGIWGQEGSARASGGQADVCHWQGWHRQAGVQQSVGA